MSKRRLGLISCLLLSTRLAFSGTAPIVEQIPDIRHRVNPIGAVQTVLDLDDYTDSLPSNRDPVTGEALPLDWKANHSGEINSSISAINELEVFVPASNAPTEDFVTFSFDGADAEPFTYYADPVVIKTVDFLLGGPLVDDALVVGDDSVSTIPYSWPLTQDEFSRFGLLKISVIQSDEGGGRLFPSISSGFGSSDFTSDTMILEVPAFSSPLFVYSPGVATHGAKAGNLGSVQLEAANLSVSADLNGILVAPLSGFSDWVRVSLTRTYDSGASDCYTVCVADVLLGVEKSLSGAPDGEAIITTPDEVLGFDDIQLSEFLGASNARAFEVNTRSSVENQRSSWHVFGLYQEGTHDGSLNGSTLPEIELTTAAPLPSYPGATRDRALRLIFDKSDNQGILLTHKGIDTTSYKPGDILTLTMNVYVDLNYGGGEASDDLINEASNGLILVLGLSAQPLGAASNFNYLNFPPSKAAAEPFKSGGVFGKHGAGGSQRTNILAAIHGRWTRHEISFRVPETGQALEGTMGIGDVVDPNGIAALIAVGRQHSVTGTNGETISGTDLGNHRQAIFIDNISITKYPGAIVMAHGATNVPMISAGWAFQFEDGLTGQRSWNSGDSIPISITRGQRIFGSFSDQNVGPNNPGQILPNDIYRGHSFYQDNNTAGWLEGEQFDDEGIEVEGDLAVLCEGNNTTALPFPSLPGGNRGMLLSPAPSEIFSNYPIPSTNIPQPHAGRVNIMTPYLDLRLMADAILPGLRVDDAVYAAGTGGADNQNRIAQNVSGVFGMRFFHHSNAREVSMNPTLTAVLSNADVTNGLVAQRLPTALASSEDNQNYGNDAIWIDDMISGNFISFNSNQRYYDLVLNSSTGGPGTDGRFPSGGNETLATQLLSQNPGAQLARVEFIRSSGWSQGQAHATITNPRMALPHKIYQHVWRSGDEDHDSLPGRYSTATISLDEVTLHSVRDTGAFFDADLCVLP